MRLRLLLAAVAGLGAGCATARRDAPVPTTARFFLETAGPKAIVVTLPLSQVNIAIEPKPVITEFDLVDVEIAQVELGPCLMFHLTGAAARDVHRMTALHAGGRLVLMVNGEPLGARRIEQPWENGIVLIFVETPDEALPALAGKLKSTAAELRRIAKKL